ncbi:hypothetical protein MMC12_001614 [Toensbergia leucococca]|nr:hypothetical protein [Toensbergia leucococca]
MQHHLPILLPLLLTLPTLFPPTHALCIQTSCTPSQIPKTCLAAPSSFPKPHRRDDTHPDDKRSVIIASRGNGICYYPSETGRLVTNVVTQMFVLPAGTYALNWAGLYEDRPSDEGRTYFELLRQDRAARTFLWDYGDTFVSDGVMGYFLVLRQLVPAAAFRDVEVWMRVV